MNYKYTKYITLALLALNTIELLGKMLLENTFHMFQFPEFQNGILLCIILMLLKQESSQKETEPQ